MTAMKDDFYHGGLTDDEVRKSREKYGVNLLTPPKRPSLWKLYLEKFEDPVVRVLLVAALFSLIISIVENEYAETIGIIAAILLATGIGFFFEYDANKKFDLLNAVNEETLVKVIRNGRVQEIPRKDVVVGDIIGLVFVIGMELIKAVRYAAQMLAGSAEMVLHSGKHPGLLKDEVCSPGGSTIAGVDALEQRAFRGSCIAAVEAAFEKTRRLG